ncbi:MAG: thermonuclease family protein [SAR324 cluster bacterium]|nr:thermonuclease family protein [SAR324 cluster bacterium]
MMAARSLFMILFFLSALNTQAQSLSESRSNLFNSLGDQSGQAFPDMLEGVVGRVSDSESIWIRIDDKSEFRKWTFKLSKNNLNISRQEIRVWLRFVSPEQSISQGKAYNDWFKKKVAYELGKLFYGRRVRVEYKYLDKIYRMVGELWASDTSINEWLIKNGWSFYLLEDTPGKYHVDYQNAEKYAQANQLGLWKLQAQPAK